MPNRWLRHRHVLIWAGIVAAVLIVAGMMKTPAAPEAETATAETAYADLVDAAWKKDQGLGDTFVSATLYTPPVVAALTAIPNKSLLEQQIAGKLSDAPAGAVPVFVTIDTITGPFADAAIETSLALTDAGGTPYALASWQPMIVPSRVVNTNEAAHSQAGMAVFTAKKPVDWSTVKSLTLTVSNLGDQPVRTFVWTSAALGSADR